jgi:4-carboxymuconolactone decarboxylase
MSTDHQQRRAGALETLKSLTGTDDPQSFADRLEAENGPLASFALNFALGDIWNRPGLSRRDRNLVVLSLLGALHQTNQLAVYVRGGINHGLTPEEIREILTHMGAYAGFPRALDAMAVANQVLAEMGHAPEGGQLQPAERLSDAERRERGVEVFARLVGSKKADPDKVMERITGQLGELGTYAIDYAFGEVWSRTQLSRRDRSLVVVSILTALGRSAELDVHVPAAVRHGVTRAELEEVMLTAIAYTGFPLAVEGMRVVIEQVKD